MSKAQGLRSPQSFECPPSGIAKPCQSPSRGATYPPKCLIPFPLVSRCSSMILLPCTSTDPHHPLESQVPAEKQEGSETWVGGAKLVRRADHLGIGSGHWRPLGTERAFVLLRRGVGCTAPVLLTPFSLQGSDASDQASVPATSECQETLEAAEALMTLKNSSWTWHQTHN